MHRTKACQRSTHRHSVRCLAGKLRQAPRRDAGSKPKRLEHIIVFQQTFGKITCSGFWGVISDANNLACTGCSRSNFLWTNWTTWTMSDVRDSSPFWHRSWKFLGDSKMFIYFLGFLDKCLASSSLASKKSSQGILPNCPNLDPKLFPDQGDQGAVIHSTEAHHTDLLILRGPASPLPSGGGSEWRCQWTHTKLVVVGIYADPCMNFEAQHGSCTWSSMESPRRRECLEPGAVPRCPTQQNWGDEEDDDDDQNGWNPARTTSLITLRSDTD